MLYLRQNSDTFVSRRLYWYHLWNEILSSVFDLPICPPDAPVISWHDHDPVTWEIMLIIPPLRCSVSSSRPWASWHHFSSGYLRSVQHVRCPAQTLHIRDGNEPSRRLKFNNHILDHMGQSGCLAKMTSALASQFHVYLPEVNALLA